MIYIIYDYMVHIHISNILCHTYVYLCMHIYTYIYIYVCIHIYPPPHTSIYLLEERLYGQYLQNSQGHQKKRILYTAIV